MSFLRLADPLQVRDAIRELKVRGAPAIGIAAAYGAYLGVRRCTGKGFEEIVSAFNEARAILISARPTAVNLAWALNRLAARLEAEKGGPPERLRAALKEEADAIRAEDEQVCRAIGENGLTLLGRDWGVLTHCNAGMLATARYGTALAPLHLGAERGYRFKVFADETRPLLQGARLTAWELAASGMDVTVICDSAASVVMSQGKVRAVLVGCDRVAANGDAANEIGTAGLAILARHYGTPFYVFAPLSTIDAACATGGAIPIERSPVPRSRKSGISVAWRTREAKVYNPAFDVTDHELITAIVTERGDS